MDQVLTVNGQANYAQASISNYGINAEACVGGHSLLTIWADMQQVFGSSRPSDRLAEQIHILVRNPDVALFVEHFRFSKGFESYVEILMMKAHSQ